MADLLNALPRRIKVASFTYWIRLVGPDHRILTGSSRNGCWGVTDLDAHRIYVDQTAPLDRFTNTLWHEINHAINAEYGIRDGSREETVANQNANGWMQVNLDNPRLEQWFHRAWQALRKNRSR